MRTREGTLHYSTIVNNQNYPTAWSSLEKAYRAIGEWPPEEIAECVVQFRVAESLSSVSLGEMGDDVAHSYFAGLKLVLADVALEALEQAKGVPIGSIHVVRPETSGRLWETVNGGRAESKVALLLPEEFVVAERETALGFDLRRILQTFKGFQTEGVLTLCLGIPTLEEREMLIEVAALSLQEFDSHFSLMAKELLSGQHFTDPGPGSIEIDFDEPI